MSFIFGPSPGKYPYHVPSAIQTAKSPTRQSSLIGGRFCSGGWGRLKGHMLGVSCTGAGDGGADEGDNTNILCIVNSVDRNFSEGAKVFFSGLQRFQQLRCGGDKAGVGVYLFVASRRAPVCLHEAVPVDDTAIVLV